MNRSEANASGGLSVSVIPQPVAITHDTKAVPFALTVRTRILAESGNAEVVSIADYLAEQLRDVTCFELAVADAGSGGEAGRGAILLTTTGAEASLGEEGYVLSVSEDGVRLIASTPCGLFRGVQTFRQLVPSVSSRRIGGRSSKSEVVFDVPAVRIMDKPRYRWRGMLLDCCRHFMTTEFVKRYIDLLACHKMNVFHWHLTEDQGWRIEIKKYPKLTEIGAYRNQDSQRYGGFYTQEDVREIVAYATSRYITIVPEIEMPGHARAAIASYPEFSCTGGPHEVANQWGIFEDVYCAGNDATFAFLEDVLTEVLDLFPSEFIHIGGDECPKARWKECEKCQARIKSEGLKNEHELQSYFVRRVEQFLSSKGRRLVGWDEILEGGLAPNATVQSWRGMKGAIAAARSGHDVIASPTSHCYLDYPHEQTPSMPRWMRVTSLEDAYSFEATPPELTAEEAKHVLGGECNMWTERTPQERVDHQVFPRLCAIAESLWSPRDRRNWGDFSRRMESHHDRLDAMGVTYHRSIPKSALGQGR